MKSCPWCGIDSEMLDRVTLDAERTILTIERLKAECQADHGRLEETSARCDALEAKFRTLVGGIRRALTEAKDQDDATWHMIVEAELTRVFNEVGEEPCPPVSG